MCLGWQWLCRRQPQRKTFFQPRVEVRLSNSILAFGDAASGSCDERADLRISASCRGEQHQMYLVGGSEFGADDELQFALLGRFVCTNDACHRAFVRQRERRITKIVSLIDKLAWMRSASQEAEVANTVKLGVAHDQNPCKYHSPFRARSRYTHRSGPSLVRTM
jgi:hypothetical protein